MRAIFVVAALLVIASSLQLDLVRVAGSSMAPTFCEGDLLIARRVGVFGYSPERLVGRAVVAKVPEVSALKRVVASGGDNVAIRSGRLELNGYREVEPYVCESLLNPYFNWPGIGEGGFAVVPQDSLFLLGDARIRSRDSTYFGPAPVSAIKSVIFTRLKRGSRECSCQT